MDYFRANPNIDVIITSIRDEIDPMRRYLLSLINITPGADFQLELALGKITCLLRGYWASQNGGYRATQNGVIGPLSSAILR